MRLELQRALQDLDDQTPPFFVTEMWSHGDTKARVEAIRILTELDSRKKSARVLVAMLRFSHSEGGQ